MGERLIDHTATIVVYFQYSGYDDFRCKFFDNGLFDCNVLNDRRRFFDSGLFDCNVLNDRRRFFENGIYEYKLLNKKSR